MKHWMVTVALIGLFSCSQKEPEYVYESESLKIKKLTDNTYLHISYLETEEYGKIPCNGMIVVNNGEALVFDTPVHNPESEELINWLENENNLKIVGVIATHFHIDCLGGLNEFHKRQIPSYANYKTIEFARSANSTIPQNAFENSLAISVGDSKVLNAFLGEGHTRDNIVSYFPDDRVVFGGCLIKSVGAGKGNLEDANLNEWSNSVVNVKETFNDAEIIVPGHGKPGGTELLDFTIELFKPY